MAREEIDPVFLTEEELQTIAEKNIVTPRLAKVRDIFIFCRFTGLAYVDVKNLKRPEVVTGVDGDLWIVKKRQKSQTPSRIPLLPIALRILAKYAGDPGCVAKDRLLPVISNQEFNSYLMGNQNS